MTLWKELYESEQKKASQRKEIERLTAERDAALARVQELEKTVRDMLALIAEADAALADATRE